MAAILVIDAHPDPQPAFGHALAQAYVQGARETGHETRLIRLADAAFPLLRSGADFAAPPSDPDILSAREDIAWAEHIVIVFPLWLGGTPALLDGFLEQIARANFLADASPTRAIPHHKGKSARLIVTMRMPSLLYWLAYGAFGVRALARGVLGFAGIAPVRRTFFGAIEATRDTQLRRIEQVRALGRRGA